MKALKEQHKAWEKDRKFHVTRKTCAKKLSQQESLDYVRKFQTFAKHESFDLCDFADWAGEIFHSVLLSYQMSLICLLTEGWVESISKIKVWYFSPPWTDFVWNGISVSSLLIKV